MLAGLSRRQDVFPGQRSLQREAMVNRLLDQTFDVAPAHELGHHAGLVVFLANVENGDDVGMEPRRPISCASRWMRVRPASSSPLVLIRAKAMLAGHDAAIVPHQAEQARKGV